MSKPTVGSLFAGIGVFDLGFERAGFETVLQVEINDWCRKVLAKNVPGAERFAGIEGGRVQGFVSERVPGGAAVAGGIVLRHSELVVTLHPFLWLQGCDFCVKKNALTTLNLEDDEHLLRGLACVVGVFAEDGPATSSRRIAMVVREGRDLEAGLVGRKVPHRCFRLFRVRHRRRRYDLTRGLCGSWRRGRCAVVRIGDHTPENEENDESNENERKHAFPGARILLCRQSRGSLRDSRGDSKGVTAMRAGNCFVGNLFTATWTGDESHLQPHVVRSGVGILEWFIHRDAIHPVPSPHSPVEFAPLVVGEVELDLAAALAEAGGEGLAVGEAVEGGAAFGEGFECVGILDHAGRDGAAGGGEGDAPGVGRGGGFFKAHEDAVGHGGFLSLAGAGVLPGLLPGVVPGFLLGVAAVVVGFLGGGEGRGWVEAGGVHVQELEAAPGAAAAALGQLGELGVVEPEEDGGLHAGLALGLVQLERGGRRVAPAQDGEHGSFGGGLVERAEQLPRADAHVARRGPRAGVVDGDQVAAGDVAEDAVRVRRAGGAGARLCHADDAAGNVEQRPVAEVADVTVQPEMVGVDVVLHAHGETV